MTIDPAEIAVTAKSLAEHFERIGIHFGPVPTAAGISDWQKQLSTETPNPVPVIVPAATPITLHSKPESTKNQSTVEMPRVELSEDSLLQGYDYPALPIAERSQRLAELAGSIAVCQRCSVLVRCRKKTVPGEGRVNPRVVFFGEAPGADEDRTGRPFVGRAGVLLTKMIEACTFKREDVFILNTIKCRPPDNRTPEPEEIANCREYFEAQLDILQPEYIVCLGAVASQSLLQTSKFVGQLRGKLHRYRSSHVLVTYHPAYLLRQEEAKKAAWADLQLMLRHMGIDPKRT